jgi:uncharacterized protein (DUF697 family)
VSLQQRQRTRSSAIVTFAHHWKLSIMKNSHNSFRPLPTPQERDADKIIRNYTLAATASGFIPFSPIAASGVAATLVLMIQSLCELYQVPFSPSRARVLVHALLGSIATRLAAQLVTSLPGMRHSLRGVSTAATASLFTATVGEFYKRHFQRGGTLANASVRDFTKYVVEAVDRGDLTVGKLISPVDTLQTVLK